MILELGTRGQTRLRRVVRRYGQLRHLVHWLAEGRDSAARVTNLNILRIDRVAGYRRSYVR
jgi:hypothetical protein